MNKFIHVLIITVIAIVLFTCSESTNVEDLAILKGKVYFVENSSLPQPLAGATVSALDYFAQGQTGANGAFEVKIDLSGEDGPVAVDLQVSKAGYESSTTSVNAQRGETTLVPDLTLQQIYSDTTVLEDTISGDAAHISIDGLPCFESHPVERSIYLLHLTYKSRPQLSLCTRYHENSRCN